jgi:XRE family transcriptional regulator, regulator of sulfur utilization
VEFQAALGLAMREARLRRGWTQDDLAAAADTDRAYIGNLETGRRNPSFSTLTRITDALGEPLSGLLERAEALRAAPGEMELRDENRSE